MNHINNCSENKIQNKIFNYLKQVQDTRYDYVKTPLTRLTMELLLPRDNE